MIWIQKLESNIVKDVFSGKQCLFAIHVGIYSDLLETIIWSYNKTIA